MQFPITIELRRSRFLDAMILCGALLASGVLSAVQWPFAAKALLLFSLWALAAWSWYSLIPRISALHLARDGQLSVAFAKSKEFVRAGLLPNGAIHPWLTIIRLSLEEGRIFTVIAVFDCLSVEDFRRLRVFLRWKADFSDPDVGA